MWQVLKVWRVMSAEPGWRSRDNEPAGEPGGELGAVEGLIRGD